MLKKEEIVAEELEEKKIKLEEEIKKDREKIYEIDDTIKKMNEFKKSLNEHIGNIPVVPNPQVAAELYKTNITF